jgi:multiple sugar transport system substrate-binding protein
MGGCFLGGCGGQSRGPVFGDEVGPLSAILPESPAHQFLREAGRGLRGQVIKVLSEATPPSQAAQKLVLNEFSALTGIEVDWVMEPLADVYARIHLDTAQEAGNHDIFYLDQSWLARFSDQVERIEPWMEVSDLAYPNWDYDDFLDPLIRYTASYNGELVALPYDITLFIAVYRRDLFERLKLSPPKDLHEWMEVTQAVEASFSPAVHGMTAQWKVGHYSLLCNATTWIWGHGGSFFNRDGSSAIESEPFLRGLEYMLHLRDVVAPAAVAWDWNEEWSSFARGRAALFASWAEFFPKFDDPHSSKIPGLAEPMDMPAALQLKDAADCGFGEKPGMSHQGGSGMALSRWGKNKEASWLFLQWLTSPDITVRTSLLGGGASATRESTYADPRIVQRQDQVGPGTTRHFPAMRRAILNSLGSEPHHPQWPDLAWGPYAVLLGRMMTGQTGPRETARSMRRATERLIPPA